MKRVLFLTLALAMSCGRTSEGENADAAGDSDGLGLNVGEECSRDRDCVTIVCWDFNDYDECCFGAVCSGSCDFDEDCRELAAEVGASRPDAASCGSDGRCDLAGAGVGAFTCAGGEPPCG